MQICFDLLFGFWWLEFANVVEAEGVEFIRLRWTSDPPDYKSGCSKPPPACPPYCMSAREANQPLAETELSPKINIYNSNIG